MKILERLFDVIILTSRCPSVNELVNELSSKWNVSKQTVYYYLNQFIKSKIIKMKKIGREKYVDFTTDFLFLIETISDMIYTRRDYQDRVRKLRERLFND